jgi:hypothetical protein
MINQGSGSYCGSPAALKRKAKTCVYTNTFQTINTINRFPIQRVDERASFEEAATSNEMNNENYTEK